jgi:hypothetical protein
MAGEKAQSSGLYEAFQLVTQNFGITLSAYRLGALHTCIDYHISEYIRPSFSST